MFSIKSAVKQFNDALIEAQRKVEESKNSLSFYEDRVEKLTKAVATINETLSDNDLLDHVQESPNARKARKKTELPKTDSDFWFGLVTEESRSGTDILNKAIQELNIPTEDKPKINALRMRQNFHLVTLESKGKIKIDGKGRMKTYALAA